MKKLLFLFTICFISLHGYSQKVSKKVEVDSENYNVVYEYAEKDSIRHNVFTSVITVFKNGTMIGEKITGLYSDKSFTIFNPTECVKRALLFERRKKQ